LRPASLRDNAVSASASNVNWVKSIAWTVNLSGVSSVIGFDAHPIRTSALSEIVRVDDHRPTLRHTSATFAFNAAGFIATRTSG
jgi:hypothetical protein